MTTRLPTRKRAPKCASPTPARDDQFFNAIMEGYTVKKAAEMAGYGHSAVYHRKRKDEAFNERWLDTVAITVERLENEADRRALQGVDEPVFFRGEQCGVIRRYSDTLLIFRLKALAPERYRERREVTGKDGGAIEANVNFTAKVLQEIDGKTRSK